MCKILYFEIFCVGVRYCKVLLLENLFTEDYVIFEKILLSLKNCIHLVNKLHCNFAFSVETFGTVKTVFLENCVTVKNCVTWKLRYFEKLRYLKTVLLWKTVLLENCVTLNNCVT